MDLDVLTREAQAVFRVHVILCPKLAGAASAESTLIFTSIGVLRRYVGCNKDGIIRHLYICTTIVLLNATSHEKLGDAV